MEIRHLKQFEAICRWGSINRAAQELYLSQPSLNNTIKRCERELGFEVFQRTPKGTVLTDKGAEFMACAERILAEYKKIEGLSAGNGGRAPISVSFLYLSYILECFLALKEQGFLFSNMLRRMEAQQVIRDVLSKNAHIGLLPVCQLDRERFEERMKGLHLRIIRLFEAVQIYATVGKGHPLAKKGRKRRLALEEAAVFPLAYYTAVPEGSVLKRFYNAKTSLRVQNRDELFLALKNNKYISFLTLTEDSGNPDLRYIPMEGRLFRTDIFAVMPEEGSLTGAERELLKRLKDTLKFL